MRKEAYFDSMTHFDFKTLLPALLQVEDRVSMAHSLESRVPLLDHRLVEFAASLPPNLKLRGLTRKYLLRKALAGRLPVVLVVNKIDRPDARIAEVVHEVEELFLDLDADEDQISFPILGGRRRPRTGQ